MKKLLKTKKDKEQFITWLAFLKAGVFNKATGALEKRNGHCCLGVGCELFIEEPERFNGYLCGGYPTRSNQPKAPKWLEKINDHAEKKGGVAPSAMNDNRRMTHSSIADKLLELYEDELYGRSKK